MKKITQMAALCVAAFLSTAISVQAQWRWNPNNWETSAAVTTGVTTSVSADNKTFIVNPYAHSTTDATARRGDIRYKKDVKFLENEPVVAVYMQFKNVTLSINDWKFDYILQQKTAIAYDESTLAYTWGTNDFSYGGRKDKISTLKDVSVSCYTSDGADDLWIFNMTAGAPFEDAWMGNGDRFVPYAPAWVQTGIGVGATQTRSWLGFVCIGTAATTDPTFNLKYCATSATVNDVFGNIEAYLNSEGGQEVREGDDTAVEKSEMHKALIFSGEGHAISPNAISMEAFNVAGAKIKEVNANRIDLNTGIYMIKVTNAEGEVTVGKAIIR